MNKLQINKRFPRILFLIFYAVASLTIIFSRPLLFIYIARTSPGTSPQAIFVNPFVSNLFSVSGMIFLMLSTLAIFSCDKTGFIFAIILSSIQTLSVFFAFIKTHVVISSGFLSSIVTISFTFLFYSFLKKQRADIVKLSVSQADLQHIIYTDELTSLASRKKITESLHFMTAPENRNNPFAIMFIDIDNFKMINDTLGHKIGDIFLQEAAHNIAHNIKPGMMLGHMGGDEFLLIIPGDFTEEQLSDFAEKINNGITHPFIYKNKDYSITCSIGVSRFPLDGKDDSEILRFADMALYKAKEKGKNCTVIFDENIKIALQLETDLHAIVDELELGIEEVEELDPVQATPAQNVSPAEIPEDPSQFYLVFQPQFISKNQQLRGYEVLSRFKYKNFGQISPTLFIPTLEKNGDIVTYGKWVMRESIKQFLKTVHDIKKAPILCVNVSTLQFRSPDFIDFLKETVELTGIPPNKLELEITESVIMYSADMVIEKLNEIHRLGIKIALDDFGTGYSSFNYLRLLPFDLLKIDKSFVDPLPKDKTGLNIVKTIINMAHGLHMEVIAEGVETKEQFDLLNELNCDFIQGFYFSKPLPLQAL